MSASFGGQKTASRVACGLQYTAIMLLPASGAGGAISRHFARTVSRRPEGLVIRFSWHGGPAATEARDTVVDRRSSELTPRCRRAAMLPRSLTMRTLARKLRAAPDASRAMRETRRNRRRSSISGTVVAGTRFWHLLRAASTSQYLALRLHRPLVAYVDGELAGAVATRLSVCARRRASPRGARVIPCSQVGARRKRRHRCAAMPPALTSPHARPRVCSGPCQPAGRRQSGAARLTPSSLWQHRKSTFSLVGANGASQIVSVSRRTAASTPAIELPASADDHLPSPAAQRSIGSRQHPDSAHHASGTSAVPCRHAPGSGAVKLSSVRRRSVKPGNHVRARHRQSGCLLQACAQFTA